MKAMVVNNTSPNSVFGYCFVWKTPSSGKLNNFKLFLYQQTAAWPHTLQPKQWLSAWTKYYIELYVRSNIVFILNHFPVMCPESLVVDFAILNLRQTQREPEHCNTAQGKLAKLKAGFWTADWRQKCGSVQDLIVSDWAVGVGRRGGWHLIDYPGREVSRVWKEHNSLCMFWRVNMKVSHSVSVLILKWWI